MSGKIGKSDCFFNIILIVVSVLAFAIPFGLSPIFVADSPAYMSSSLAEGIVPIYPSFISLNRLIFSQDYYLQAVVLEQIVFAAFCTDLFVISIKREMGLRWIETYIFLLFALIPYTVFMPDGMTSRYIVTEALAYPCFYLLMVFVLKGLWNNKFSSIFISDIIAILMALTRTQLRIALLIPVGAFFLLWLRSSVWNKKMGKFCKVISGVLISCVIFILSYAVFLQGNLVLQRALAWTSNVVETKTENQVNAADTKVTDVSVANTDVSNTNVTDVNVASTDITEEIDENNVAEAVESTESNTEVLKADSNNRNIDSQFFTVMFVKVMVAADKRDANLFQDDTIRQAYIYVCNRMEQDQWGLGSMDKDLFIGDRVQNSIVNIAVIDKYLNDFIGEYPDSEIDISDTKNEFLSVLLRAHPFRWMLSGILQFPSGFISSVFVHRRNMYWLSYLVTVVIYALAVIMCIARRKDIRQRDFMMTSIYVNILFVAATSMMFVCFKRYVNYGFGMFYISLYCIMREPIVDFIKKRYDKTGAAS